MPKCTKRLICGAVLLAIAAVWIFYAFPRTPERMVKGLDFDECTRITLDATEYPTADARDGVRYSLVLERGDEGFDGLIAAVRTQNFSRKALGALSKNAAKFHPISAGDTGWNAIFVCGEDVFRLEDFFGSMSMTSDPGDRYAKLRAGDQGAFSAEIFEMIRQNPGTEISTDY